MELTNLKKANNLALEIKKDNGKTVAGTTSILSRLEQFYRSYLNVNQTVMVLSIVCQFLSDSVCFNTLNY